MNALMNKSAYALPVSVARPVLKAVFCAVLSIGVSGSVLASGSAERGLEKSAVCAACHGTTGVSEIPTNPTLAGQYESYIIQALQSYRSGSRQNAIMAGFATGLSDQDIEDLAAYFSSQESPLRTAPTD